ncbi:MAG: hypothetical protein JXA03_11850 [Bacteroidales bacterium]|nr:hypothetical protein [Bacteroidales bacterium]
MKTGKTIFLSFVVLLSTFLSSAQEEPKKSLRPAKHNFSFEVDFTPFNTTAPIDLHGFRGRLFLSDKLALRTGFNFDMVKQYSEFPSEHDGIVLYGSNDEKFTLFGINTGVEYHFLNSGRVSPYFGAAIGFENKSSESVYEDVVWDYNGSSYTYYIRRTEIENSWLSYGIVYPHDRALFEEDAPHRAYNRFSGLAILGADIYIVKHFYMGVEIGLGVDILKYKEIIIKIDDVAEPTIPEAEVTDYGFNVNNAIRLGFWF